jgi:glycosyltransferase involved in cell wall biosynthesis
MSLTFHNRKLQEMPQWQRAAVAVWNRAAYEEVRETIRERRPQLVHIHNTFPLASPAVIHAAKAARLPVVVTVHNYRLLCVNALFFRDGRVCEDCLRRAPWRGVVHGCYSDSRAASAVVASMLAAHRARGTWDLVDRFIALTEFARSKFLEAGFFPEKVVVKPNFVDPDPGTGKSQGGYALFVGRLSPEKGIGTLLKAWELTGGKVPLKLVGDGPLAGEVLRAAERVPGVTWLGQQRLEEVYALMGEAVFLVFPSECYEGFPKVLVEALARGLPVVSTSLGSQGSIIVDGRTGVHCRPGDPEDLAAKVESLVCQPDELARMRREARAEYEAKYAADRNYQLLMEIHEEAIEQHLRGP